jgi:IS1 family transposase
MNQLPFERRSRVINCLIEGNSIRSTERLSETHRDTIMRLTVQVGEGCARLLDNRMKNLDCRRLQVDEIWRYVQKKQRHLSADDDPRRVGDMWTFVAIDAETKLVPSHLVGKRDRASAHAFIGDLSDRMANRVQLSSDGLPAYIDAIAEGFGRNVDYGQIVKSYEAEPVGPGRYSPSHVTGSERTRIFGLPEQEHISTSFIERQNLTMRMSMRRFTRLTNAFSRKVENLRAAVALHFAWYNFVRIHRTLRCTPAMAAGLSSHIWELDELIAETSN